MKPRFNPEARYNKKIVSTKTSKSDRSKVESTYMRVRLNASNGRSLRLNQAFGRCRQMQNKKRKDEYYQRVRQGLKKSNPAAILLYVFHKYPNATGLTSRRIKNYIRSNFKSVCGNSRQTDRVIGDMLRSALLFGMIEKKGQKYFLVNRKKK